MKNVNVLYGIIALLAIVVIASNWKRFSGNEVDASGDVCAGKIKDLGNRFGESNLNSKTARDFYNYLLG